MNRREGEVGKARPGRLRRWSRRLVIFVIIAGVLLVAAWSALSSSWFLAPRIESMLSKLVGGKVTIGTADLSLGGRLHLTDLRILVPSIPGPAGELLHVPDVTFNLDRDELLAGRLSVQQLTIDDALLRLSEDLDTGRFNIGGLKLAQTGTMVWPRIELRSGIAQIGEHRGTIFQPSGELRVNGSFRPDPSPPTLGSQDWYAFDLQEIISAGAANQEGMHVEGRYNVATAEGSSFLSGVTFEPQRAKLLPRVAREWWRTINPSGSLQPIGFQIGADGRYQIEIAMDGIDWSLPVPSFDPQRDTRAPRMTDVRGSVVIHDGQVDLISLSGEIDSVRYGLTGSFASVDESPGFDLTFDVEHFDLSRNMNMLTALPDAMRELVDNQLIQLGGPTGLMEGHVTLKRAPRESGDAGESNARPVRASGRVELVNAEGTYRGFPYPLTGLTGAVEFDDDEIRIMALAGRGPTGGQVYVSGTISPPGPDPEVNVELYANSVPIDEYLREALGDSHSAALDEFFNRDWANRLHAQDLFLRSGDVADLSDEVMTLMREYRDLAGTDGSEPDAAANARQDAIRNRMAEIEVVLKRPTFELNGRININSTITRARGASSPTKIASVISLANPAEPLCIMYDKFPFPVRLVSGEILIDYDHVEVLKDLVVQGLSGGSVVVTGWVNRVREPAPRVEPHLALHAQAIPIDEFLLRAIPDRGWKELDSLESPGLSKGARVVAGLRINGQVSADGQIFADDQGKVAFDLDVTLADAVTRPTSEPSVLDSELDWIWPSTLPLTQVQGSLTVHRHGANIHYFRGRSAEQDFDASGLVDWSDGTTSLELKIDGQHLDLKPHLLDLASAIGNDKGLEDMRRFWNRFEPRGTTDASLVYQRTADGQTGFDLTLRPGDSSLIINDQRVEMTNPHGLLHVAPGRVTFDEVKVDAACEGNPAGSIALDGVLSWQNDLATDLNARVEGGRFEASIFKMFSDGITGLLSPTQSESAAPAGVFDASFNYTRAAGSERPDYLINLQPQSLDLSRGAERFEVRRITGSALISPSSVKLSNLFGSYQDGLIRLSGEVDRGENVDAALQLSVSAESLTDRVRAVLPKAANQLIDAIDLSVGQSVELNEADIHYTRQPNPDDAALPRETLAFDGTLNVRDASMNLSFPITELDGSLALHAQRRSDEPWLRGSVELNVSRMLVLGRLITDVQAELLTGEEPGLVHLPRLVGDCYGGRLAAEGRVRVPWLGEPGQYDLRLSLASVAVDPVLRRFAPRPTAADASGEIQPAETEPAPAPTTNTQRHRPGTLAADLTIAGTFGEPGSRIGCGEIRVRDAELYEVPLAMWALQLSALTLPVSTSFNQAEVAYYVEGDEVVFEHLLLDSPAMSLVGSGVLNYTTKALDMRFNTSSKLRAPLFTPLWEGLRDLFMSIHVTGTLEKPLAKLEAHSDSPIAATRPAGSASGRIGETAIAPAHRN